MIRVALVFVIWGAHFLGLWIVSSLTQDVEVILPVAVVLTLAALAALFIALRRPREEVSDTFRWLRTVALAAAGIVAFAVVLQFLPAVQAVLAN